MKAANDNTPRTLAAQLSAVLEFRNRPDNAPDPLRSNWSTDPSTVIADGVFDGDDEPEAMSEDLLLEITPSIAQIKREIRFGDVVRRDPEAKNSPIVSIGKLRFSDGSQHERAMVNGATGVEVKKVRMRAGTMLGSAEKLGGTHGGTSPSAVSISNTNMTGRILGWEVDENGERTAKSKNFRGYIPAIRKRRKGKSMTAAQSRINLAGAIANTQNMPPVTYCPPGIATGTARYSDQFIGMKIGSTGKGGAPNWVDEFMALRDHENWQTAVRAADTENLKVITKALTAKSIAELGDYGHRRTRERQGWRKLTAANDNLSLNKKMFAA